LRSKFCDVTRPGRPDQTDDFKPLRQPQHLASATKPDASRARDFDQRENDCMGAIFGECSRRVPILRVLTVVDAAFLIGGRRGRRAMLWLSCTASVETERTARQELVFLCHGFAEHCGYFHQLAEPLAAAGLLTVGHDFYGHGLSEGNVNQLRSIDTLVDVAAAHLAKLKLEFPDCIVYGVGYSMGALVLHRMCGRSPQPPPVSHGVWLSPALQPAGMKLTKRRVQLSKWLLPRLPNLPLPAGAAAHGHQHQAARAVHSGVRLDAGSYASNPAGSITLPTLLITGTADRIADPARSAAFVAAGQALGKPVTGRAYLGARHQLHTDLPTVGVKLHQDLMQWFAASQD
uniref:Hydrolase_4 domain-containing protein n=1 Tax=Macrostomum lignano TaxID=282301 RepID=A0A1I8F9Q5_9PLAT